VKVHACLQSRSVQIGTPSAGEFGAE
jgi:hypothetical protein